MSALALFGNRAGLGLLDGVRLREAPVPLGDLAQLLVVPVQHHDFLLGQVLDVDEPVARPLEGGDQLAASKEWVRQVSAPSLRSG